MIAIKGNKELKILETEMESLLEKGFTIYDDDLELLEEPANAKFSKEEVKEKINEALEEREAEFEEKEAEIHKLEKENADLKKQLEEKEAELKKAVDKTSNK